MLEKVDKSMRYMRNDLKFSDANKFYAILQRLQTKLVRNVKNYIQILFKQCTNDINKYKTEQQETTTLSAQETNSSSSTIHEYIELRTLAGIISPLLSNINQRSEQSSSYRDLLTSCYELYYQNRISLLNISDKSKINKENDVQISFNIIQIRSIISELIEKCTLETSLYHDFFDINSNKSTLKSICNYLCGEFYSNIRAQVIHESNFMNLVELIHVLKDEILEDSSLIHSTTLDKTIFTVVERLLHDIQERLAYLAQLYIRDNVTMFSPTQQHINYPKFSLTSTKPVEPVEQGKEEDKEDGKEKVVKSL